MGIDVLKKLKSESTKRLQQQQQDQQRGVPATAGPSGTAGASGSPVAANAPVSKSFEPLHKYFVSQNWKTLLERKPKVAPKAAAAVNNAGGPDGRAAYDVIAIDCEMVGVGSDGIRSVLARVSIVDSEGSVLMDRFVRPQEEVTDYRTFVTGITAERLKRKDVMKEKAAVEKAAGIMAGKIIVGHALQNDFKVLQIEHEHALIRDTARFKPLRLPDREKKTPSLKRLAFHWLQETIQEGSHDSVQDARAALRLYRLKSRLWEKQMRTAMNHLEDSGALEDEEEGEPVKRPAPGKTTPSIGPNVFRDYLKQEGKADKKAESQRKQNQNDKHRKKKRKAASVAQTAKAASFRSTANSEGGSRPKGTKRKRKG